MKIVVKCPKCDRSLPVLSADAPGAIICGGCQHQTPLKFSPAIRTDQAVDVCPVCQGKDFYARKDFDPQMGLAVVIVGALISGAFYWFGMDLIAYGILAGAVVLDLIVARWLGEVTVCYRCHAEFRGKHPVTAPAFDLHLADVFELEYERRIGRR